MKKYAFGFVDVIQSLDRLRETARIWTKTGSSYSTPKKVSDGDRLNLSESLAKMRIECEVLGISPTADLISFMQSGLDRKEDDYTYNDLLRDLDTLNFTFANDLRKRFFFRIADDKLVHFQDNDPFGPEAGAAFPFGKGEFQNAGSCFALEQYDASVFHLMRSLERGLGALAAKFGVPFQHDNWQNVIDQIEAAIRKMNSGFGADWKEQQKFFSQAASQFMFIKDAWRNHVMHVRDVYDEGRAFSILSHVREFMQVLAKGGLKEPA